MMARRKKKKRKLRIMFLLSLIGFVLILILGYSLVLNLNQINSMNNEKNQLKKDYLLLKEEEESLKSDIDRLSDDEYIARYAREKYFYSKDGELILRIDN